MTSGQGIKGQAFKATAEAVGHTLRVPVQHEGKPLSVEVALTDLVGGGVVCAGGVLEDGWGGLGGWVDRSGRSRQEEEEEEEYDGTNRIDGPQPAPFFASRNTN